MFPIPAAKGTEWSEKHRNDFLIERGAGFRQFKANSVLDNSHLEFVSFLVQGTLLASMKFAVPPNVLYMLFTFSLMDLINQIQLLTFPTLASTLVAMNNHTLKAHFGIEPSEAR